MESDSMVCVAHCGERLHGVCCTLRSWTPWRVLHTFKLDSMYCVLHNAHWRARLHGVLHTEEPDSIYLGSGWRYWPEILDFGLYPHSAHLCNFHQEIRRKKLPGTNGLKKLPVYQENSQAYSNSNVNEEITQVQCPLTDIFYSYLPSYNDQLLL